MRIIVVCLLGALWGTDASAMRCGKQLVYAGMNRIQVEDRCGSPNDRSRRFETIYREINEDETVAREIEIEEWFYKGRSRDLDRRLIFVDGYMVREEVP
jgi:hypothetical protein